MTYVACRGCNYIDTGEDPHWEAHVLVDDGLCEYCFRALSTWWKATRGTSIGLQVPAKNHAEPVAVDEWLQAGAPGAGPAKFDPFDSLLFGVLPR